jgi:hypothetical protein
MSKSSKEWLVPLTGIAFILVLVASFIIIGEDPPEAKEGGQEIIDFYVDNKDSIRVGTLMTPLAAVLLIFFFAYVNKLVSAARTQPSLTATVAVVGAGIVGVAASIDAMLEFALAEAAEDLDPAAAQAIQGIWDNDFIPFALGTALAFLATGIGLVKSGILPKWLGWVAVALGVLAITPVGFFAAPVAALWIVVVSIMLAMRARNGAGAAPAPAG